MPIRWTCKCGAEAIIHITEKGKHLWFCVKCLDKKNEVDDARDTKRSKD